MLPWLEKLGHKIPKWDFRVNGVSSISADVHKFGFGAKGASVLAYTGMDYLKHQFILTTDFPGGIYVSPTILGTRPGGPLAAAWAAMKHLGENGYLQLAQQMMDGANKLRRGLESIACIVVVGDPCMNIISYTTRNNRPDIFVVADQLENKGWMVDRQQFPECIHLTVLPTNLPVIDEYLSDLKQAIAFAEAHPEATAKGNAALYGLMARIPFRGMVEKNVVKILEEMYSAGKTPTPEKEPEQKSIADNNPAWMGRLSRFLSWLKRLK
jgi:glutamate/tyrosine decarboxylase-like PLP-dependent enzyme